MSDERCKEMVPNGGRSVMFHQCKRKSWKDGYCKQHHPETVKKRREESEKNYDKNRKESPWYKLKECKNSVDKMTQELRCLLYATKAARDELRDMYDSHHHDFGGSVPAQDAKFIEMLDTAIKSAEDRLGGQDERD